jgi:hypothetical protein
MLSYALVSVSYLLIATHVLLGFLRVVLQIFGGKFLYLAEAILIRYGEAQLLQHLIVLFVIEERVSDNRGPVKTFCRRVLQALAYEVERDGGD